MKKTISIILFILISMVSYSQSGVFVSIDNQPKVEMIEYNTLDQATRNTIVTQNSVSVVTIDFDKLLTSNPTYSANLSLWIGTQWSLSMSGPTGIVASGTIQATGNTFTFSALTSSFSTGAEQYKLKLTGSTQVAQQTPLLFFLVHETNPFTVSLSQTNNTLSVQFSDYQYTPYNLQYSNTKFEYVLSNSSVVPTTSLVGSANVSYTSAITSNDNSAIKYFHIRSTDTIISIWYTYSVQLIYTPPTTVGINEISNVTDFKVYPNPAVSEITISYTSRTNIDKVSIYNLNGQEISSTAVESMGDNKLTIDLQNYSPGFYIARVGNSSYKFIKQ